MFELANQRMSHIELHLAFFNDSGPTPMQEDPSVTHVLVNLHFSDPPSRLTMTTLKISQLPVTSLTLFNQSNIYCIDQDEVISPSFMGHLY